MRSSHPLPQGVQTGTLEREHFPTLAEGERVETLISGPAFRIERILSSGQFTPTGEWFDQRGDEWVLLMEGEATIGFEGGLRCALKPGDWVFLPARVRHRVESTSAHPGCVWLAVHLTSL